MPPPTLHQQENHLPQREVIIVVLTLGAVLCVVNMDANGISTMLPTMASDLKGEKTISWAGSSSLIATTVFTVVYGRFSDIFGRTSLFVGALVVFAAADLCCGFAVDPSMLYVFRAITGASGGGVGNLAMIVASDIVPLRQRGRYQGIAGSFMALGNVLGPFIGAAFATRSTWRGFFWLLSPLGLMCAALAAYLLPITKPTEPFLTNVKKIDGWGSLTSTITIICFMIPITGGGSYYEWDSPMVISMLAISGLSFLAFLFVEWKVAKLPIIPLSLFRTRDVCALFLQTFALGWVNQSNLYFLPLYYQNLRGWSTYASAALLLPIIGIQIIVSALAGRIMSKRGSYGGVIRFGSVFLFVGSCIEIIFDRSTSPVAIVFILLLVGIGIGAANQPMVVAMQAKTKRSERAVVTSCRNFARFFGAACGLGVSSAVLQSSLKSGLSLQYQELASSAYSLASLGPEDRVIIDPAYAKAIRNVFITNAAVGTVCALCCFAWRDNGYDSRPQDHDEEEVEVKITPPLTTEPGARSAVSGEEPVAKSATRPQPEPMPELAGSEIGEKSPL